MDSLETLANGEKSMAYIDLGLSVKWAACNLGASSPEANGDYFAWAGTSPRAGDVLADSWFAAPYYLSGDSYKNVRWRKYTGAGDKAVLDADDDAATMSLGSPWRMPMANEIKELLNKCTWIWVTQCGKNGFRVMGPNGNSIFLPAAGSLKGVDDEGKCGFYWSSSLAEANPNYSIGLYFNSRGRRMDGMFDRYRFLGCSWDECYRYVCRSVRPVHP